MAFLGARTHIAAPPERVWDLLRDWEGQAAWMVDATECAVVGDRREGVGTRVRAVTTFAGGIPVADPMEVTRWEEGRLIEIRHLGRVVRGMGWFELSPTPWGTRFEWAEEIDPPLGPLGELGAAVARPALEGMLRASLARLKRLAESGARTGARAGTGESR